MFVAREHDPPLTVEQHEQELNSVMRFHLDEDMLQLPSMAAIASIIDPTTRSAAAERMRRYRQRRRDGLRCFIIELRETEVDVLIRKGLLSAESRQDYASVQSAFYALLDDALGELRDA